MSLGFIKIPSDLYSRSSLEVGLSPFWAVFPVFPGPTVVLIGDAAILREHFSNVVGVKGEKSPKISQQEARMQIYHHDMML